MARRAYFPGGFVFLLGLVWVVFALGCAPRKPPGPAPLYYTAERAIRQGYYQQAIDAYRVFLSDPGPEGQPYVPRAYYMLALAYYRLGRYADGLAALEELELAQPGYRTVQTLALRGDLERALGNPVAAVRDWDRAWRIAGPLDRQKLQKRIQEVLGEISLEEAEDVARVVHEPAVLRLVSEAIVAKGGSALEELERLPEPREEELATAPETQEERGVLAAWLGSDRSRRPRTAAAAPSRRSELEKKAERIARAGKVAFLAPQSGPEAATTQRLWTAAKLGFGEETERLVALDTGRSETALRDVWRTVSRDPEIVAVIAYPGRDLEDAFVALARATPVAVFLLSDREVEASGYIYRLGLSKEEEVATLADYALDRVRVRHFGTLRPDTPDARQYAELFRKEITRRGGVLVGESVYTDGAGGWQEELAQLKRWRRPDRLVEAVFLPDSSPDVATLAMAINTKFPDVIVLGVQAWNRPELPADFPWLRAFFVDRFYAERPLPEVSEFVEKFQSEGGTRPGRLEAEAYAAANLAASGLARGVHSRAEMQNWLAEAPPPPVVSAEPMVIRLARGRLEEAAPVAFERTAEFR
ncbi:MAG: hypothetical protein KatS3mg076_1519 [Candidatus Binatia bacterium]|nr:MAG: hypothetical protein KatS3mg076_1519 [Candidatus Binatia bacterium]